MARRTGRRYPGGPGSVDPANLRGVRYLTLRYRVTLDLTKFTIPKDFDIEGATAAAIAEKMVTAAQAKLKLEAKRPQSHTGRLSAAIDDPRAREIKGNKIELFKTKFLDEYVPYWRAIDQGSTRALGRIITGVFTDGGGSLYPFPAQSGARAGRRSGTPGPKLTKKQELARIDAAEAARPRNPEGQHPSEQQHSAGIGRHGDRLFRQGASSRVGPRRSPTAATTARQMLQDAGYQARFANRVSGRVRRPITAEHYVKAAREAFHHEDAQRLAEEAVKGLFRRP